MHLPSVTLPNLCLTIPVTSVSGEEWTVKASPDSLQLFPLLEAGMPAKEWMRFQAHQTLLKQEQQTSKQIEVENKLHMSLSGYVSQREKKVLLTE